MAVRARAAQRLGIVLAALSLVSATFVLKPPAAEAITYGFKVRTASVQYTGGWSIECAAWWDNAAFSTIVVTQVTVTECYAPDPYGIEAPAVTAYGVAAATGAATALEVRSSLTVCVRAVFYYVQPYVPPGAGTHDSGLVCSADNAYSLKT